MTRIYLSPTATFFAKVGLIFIEFLIGLYNLITYPIRKITIKRYCGLLLFASAFYVVGNFLGLKLTLEALALTAIMLAVAIIITRMFYKYLKNKVSPKIAFLISSPMGIPLNKFYKVA